MILPRKGGRSTSAEDLLLFQFCKVDEGPAGFALYVLVWILGGLLQGRDRGLRVRTVRGERDRPGLAYRRLGVAERLDQRGPFLLRTAPAHSSDLTATSPTDRPRPPHPPSTT